MSSRCFPCRCRVEFANMQDPGNPRARIYKPFVKNEDRNRTSSRISQGLATFSDVGDGDAGLASRQLLAETVVSTGAAFTDDHNKMLASNRGKGKKGKGKGGRQDRLRTRCASQVL